MTATYKRRTERSLYHRKPLDIYVNILEERPQKLHKSGGTPN